MTPIIPQSVVDKAKAVRLLVLDVDGVLSDGRLYFGNGGEELKAFNILDGLGIKLLQDSGVKVAIITGRQSHIVADRARQLGIERVLQSREDKLTALEEMRAELGLPFEHIAYVGDDLPDLAAIRRAGLGITVANGHAFVAEHAAWQTRERGGEGAVRAVCELIMHAQGTLQATLNRYL